MWIGGIFGAYQGGSPWDGDCPDRTGRLPQRVPNHLDWNVRTVGKTKRVLSVQLTVVEGNLQFDVVVATRYKGKLCEEIQFRAKPLAVLGKLNRNKYSQLLCAPENTPLDAMILRLKR